MSISRENIEEANSFIAKLDAETKDMKNVLNYSTKEESSENFLKPDENYKPLDSSEDYTKEMDISINPDTGERQILGQELKSDNNIDDIINNLEESNDVFSVDKEISTQDLSYIDNTNKPSILSIDHMSEEDLTKILGLANRIIKKEKVSAYKELPDNVKEMIDNHIKESGLLLQLPNVAAINRAKNVIAEELMQEFINNINVNRAKSDFAKELEALYIKSAKDINEVSVEFMETRNEAYREAADKIEDPKKKKMLLDILDRIEEATNLTELKEFAKKCKIKPIELEKPDNRVFSRFLAKYKNSSNNMYDIKLAQKALLRNILDTNYTVNDINSFLIAFCKQVMNYDVENPLDHAYMYYVIYNCAIMDGYKNDKFKHNVIEVINILREGGKINGN